MTGAPPIVDERTGLWANLKGGGWPLVGLVAIGAGLRLFRIDDQLWIDEFSALESISRSPLAILTEWPGYSSHILFELFASISLSIFGESPFSIRLPAAILGVAAIWLIHRLASRWYDNTVALVVAGLLTFSYHHVQFSQNARGYTMLMILFLIVTLLLDAMREEGRVRPAIGVAYGVAAALAAYSQPFGVFIAAGHLAAVLGAAALSRLRGEMFDFPVKGLVGAVILAGMITTLLYAPFVADIFQFAQGSVADPGEGPRLGFGVVVEVVEGLLAAFHGPVGLGLAAVVGLVGLLSWWRTQPLLLASFVMPLILEMVTFAAIGAGIHPRYFAIALPILFLVGGVGLVRTVSAGVGLLRLNLLWTMRTGRAVLAMIVLLSAVPLVGYYAVPKQDYLGAIEVLEARAQPGDIKVGVHLAGSIMNDFYGAGFEQVMVLDDLLRLEASGTRVWLVTTLERLLEIQDAALYAHVQRYYDLDTYLPGSVGDAAMRIYVR